MLPILVRQVHILLKTQRDRAATSIDKVLRISIPWVLYPVVTVALLLAGWDQQSLCPHSPSCGAGPSSEAFRQYAKTFGQVAWIFGGVGIFGGYILDVPGDDGHLLGHGHVGGVLGVNFMWISNVLPPNK